MKEKPPVKIQTVTAWDPAGRMGDSSMGPGHLPRRDDLTQRTLQGLAKFLQLRCCEAPFWNDLNGLPFSKKNKSTMILDTPPERCPVGLHGTCSSPKSNSRVVNIEKELPMQMLTAPVKFLG